MKKTILIVSVLAAAALLLTACPAAAPTPQVVRETVVVTQVVEKVVTPTPVPKPAVFRVAGGWEAPPAYHGNYYAPGGVGAAWWWVSEPLFHYIPASGELVMRLATEVDDAPDAFTVKLQPNAKWHDGTPFTSKDVWCTFYVQRLFKATIWNFLADVETPDDQTVVFRWDQRTPLADRIIAAQLINAPYHIYGEICDGAKEAGDDEEALNQLKEQLSAIRPERPVGTGPFKVKTVTASEMILEKFQDHYAADKVAFDEVRILRWSSNEVIWAFLLGGELDASHPATPKDLTEQILARQPEMELVLPSDLAQFGIIFNMRQPPFSELKFRQAIAHAIDRKQLREVALFYAGDVDEYAHNILTSFRDQWLDEEFLQTLTSYEYDRDKAAALLEELGYSRAEDGTWQDPDGNPVTFEVYAPAGYSDWVLACENLATQLSEFGMPSECRPIDNPVYWPQLTTGDYQIALEWSATWWGFAHPWVGYRRHFLGDTGIRAGVPETLPGPDGTPVNLEELVTQIGLGDIETQKEAVRTAAWIANENVYVVPYLEKKLQIFRNGAHVTGWPPADDPIWSLAGGGIERVYATLMVQGRLQPK